MVMVPLFCASGEGLGLASHGEGLLDPLRLDELQEDTDCVGEEGITIDRGIGLGGIGEASCHLCMNSKL